MIRALKNLLRPAQIEAQKKRDEERKARFAALRAKKRDLACKNELDGGGDI